MTDHTVKAFDEDITRLRGLIGEMGGLAEVAIEEALASLVAGDTKRAEKVVKADKKLDDMFNVVNNAGKGAIVFINQQSQSTNLLNRLAILKENQVKGQVTKAPSITMDNKDFGIGAQILHDLNISRIKLISNSKQTKRVGMIGYGLEITDYVNY